MGILTHVPFAGYHELEAGTHYLPSFGYMNAGEAEEVAIIVTIDTYIPFSSYWSLIGGNGYIPRFGYFDSGTLQVIEPSDISLIDRNFARSLSRGFSR